MFSLDLSLYADEEELLAAITAGYYDGFFDSDKFSMELDSVDMAQDDANFTVIEAGVEMIEICIIGKVVTAEADFGAFVDAFLDEG